MFSSISVDFQPIFSKVSRGIGIPFRFRDLRLGDFVRVRRSRSHLRVCMYVCYGLKKKP